MNILAVDDETIMLKELEHELKLVFPENVHIQPENSSASALKWVQELKKKGEKLDYAFLDICMAGKDGLSLAEEIKKIYPRVVLMFCTAHTEYAYGAIRMYAKGYLLKPVNAEDIISTLNEMVPDWKKNVRRKRNIRVQAFGHFEVFVEGKPLVFEREKAKELLAYLIDRHGSSLTTEQIATVLWEDKTYDRTLKNYVSTVYTSLKKTLKAVGIEDILIKTRNHLSVDISKIKCDAYEFEKGEAGVLYKNEYMVNYSWGEYTAGRYEEILRKRNNSE